MSIQPHTVWGQLSPSLQKQITAEITVILGDYFLF